MALTKKTYVDQTTIDENKIVFYREVTVIAEDDVELSRSYHRYTLLPGQDLKDVSDDVAKICNCVWTSDVIASYKSLSAIKD